MISPSAMTLKFTGSLSAGCCGPIGTRTSGIYVSSFGTPP